MRTPAHSYVSNYKSFFIFFAQELAELIKKQYDDDADKDDDDDAAWWWKILSDAKPDEILSRGYFLSRKLLIKKSIKFKEKKIVLISLLFKSIAVALLPIAKWDEIQIQIQIANWLVSPRKEILN